MVEIYPSGQLGDDARCYQSMEMGALDLYRGNSMSLVDCGNPMMSALVLPYVSGTGSISGMYAAVIWEGKYLIISRTVPV